MPHRWKSRHDHWLNVIDCTSARIFQGIASLVFSRDPRDLIVPSGTVDYRSQTATCCATRDTRQGLPIKRFRFTPVRRIEEEEEESCSVRSATFYFKQKHKKTSGSRSEICEMREMMMTSFFFSSNFPLSKEKRIRR
jgi:hypothetical protein